MTRLEAVRELINDANRERASTTSAKRVVKACRALGLDQTEVIGTLRHLGYCDENGQPYSPRVSKVW